MEWKCKEAIAEIFRIEEEITGSSMNNLGARKRQEGIGSQIVVDEWNGLSNQVASAESLGSFKKLDNFMDEDNQQK